MFGFLGTALATVAGFAGSPVGIGLLAAGGAYLGYRYLKKKEVPLGAVAGLAAAAGLAVSSVFIPANLPLAASRAAQAAAELRQSAHDQDTGSEIAQLPEQATERDHQQRQAPEQAFEQASELPSADPIVVSARSADERAADDRANAAQQQQQGKDPVAVASASEELPAVDAQPSQARLPEQDTQSREQDSQQHQAPEQAQAVEVAANADANELPRIELGDPIVLDRDALGDVESRIDLQQNLEQGRVAEANDELSEREQAIANAVALSSNGRAIELPDLTVSQNRQNQANDANASADRDLAQARQGTQQSREQDTQQRQAPASETAANADASAAPSVDADAPAAAPARTCSGFADAVEDGVQDTVASTEQAKK